MAKNIKNQKVEKIESVGEAVSKTELFFKKYGKTLGYTGFGLIVIAAIIMAVIQFYSRPLKQEAIDQMFTAEQYFRAGDYEKALLGDGNALGFAQIIEDYGSMAGQAVYLYAGICELQNGNAEKALSYLEKYKGKENVLKARSIACMGDAWSMLEDYGKAVDAYVKAAQVEDNIMAATYYFKAGILCEETGNTADALKYYRIIKEEYPDTFEGFEIDKYISRIEIAE